MRVAVPDIFLTSLLLWSRATADDLGDELGEAASLFSGPLEFVATDPKFAWLESPIWSDVGKYLLFSDVKWTDDDGNTCGMIWKYDDENGVTEFLRCSGIAGPGPSPSNLADYIEAGSNGLFWGWDGDDVDLLVCQHGKHRIIRFNPNEVNEDGTIEEDKVVVLAETYNGTMLNAPNDLVLDYDTGTLYFTDPPFGRQKFSAENAFVGAFEDMTQDVIGVYAIVGNPDPAVGPVEPKRVLTFDAALSGPNGVALTDHGDLVLPITDFEDPRTEVYKKVDGAGDTHSAEPPEYNETAALKLQHKYRIKGENSNFPPLNDGITYSSELDVLFVSGPAGVYIYNATTYDMLGFLRIDDLNSNNVLGGGYLWITANTRLMRIPLASESTESEVSPGEGDEDSSEVEGEEEISSTASSAASASAMQQSMFSYIRVAGIIIGFSFEWALAG